MKKLRFISVLLVMVLLGSLTSVVPALALPSNLNVDEVRTAALARTIETAQDVQSLQTGALNVSGVTRDGNSGTGSYAAKVTTGSGADATFTLSSAATSFEVGGSATYSVWVKPGLGSKWIEFYLNGSLIKTAGVKDGRYLVGTQLTSGKWQKVELLLTEATPMLTHANALKVKTNGAGAVWYFDDVIGGETVSQSANLSEYVNGKTELVGGTLRLNAGLQQAVIGDGFDTETVTTISSWNFLTLAEQTAGMTLTGTAALSATGNATREFIFTNPIRLHDLSISGSGSGTYVLEYFDEDTQIWIMVYSSNSSGMPTGGGNLASRWRIRMISGTRNITSISVTGATYIHKQSFTMSTDVSTLGLKMTPSKHKDYIFYIRGSLDAGTTWSDWIVPDENGIIYGLPQPSSGSATCTIECRAIRMDAINNNYYPSPAQPLVVIEKVFSGTANSLALQEDATLDRLRLRESERATHETKWQAFPIGTTAVYLSDDGQYVTYLENQVTSGSLLKLGLTSGETTNLNIVFSLNSASYACSDNGRYFAYFTASKVYRYDLKTGTAFAAVTAYKSGSATISNDGTVACQDGNGIQLIPLSGALPTVYIPTNNGNVLIGYQNNYICYYYSIYTSGKANYYACLKDLGSDKIYTMQSNVSMSGYIFDGPNTTLYYKTNGYKAYNFFTTQEKTLPSQISNIHTVMNDGRLFVSYNQSGLPVQGFYDLKTSTFVSLKDYTGGMASSIENNCYQVTANYTCILWNDNGTYKTMPLIREEKDGMKISNNRVLLTFDGGLSFDTYKNGRWETILKGKSPTADDIAKHGMTTQQVNALTKTEFAKLYAGGRQIYSVGFSMLLRVEGAYQPALAGFEVITSGNKPYAYAVKSKAFDAANWRKINKIYSVEAGPRAFDALYFLHTGNTYYYRNASGTLTSMAAAQMDALLSNPRANWEQLSEYGFDAGQLRALPESTLTPILAGNTLSVVYAMRVPGTSTVGYKSEITIDFAAQRFSTATVTLEITLTSGEKLTFPGMAREKAELFMDWLQKRQYGYGPFFYNIEVTSGGTTTYHYINYYTIQAAKVS